MKSRLFLIIPFLSSFMLLSKPELSDLLGYNLAGRDIASLCDYSRELTLYKNALQNESNYSGCSKLEDWISDSYDYPYIHLTHQKIVDVVKSLDISSVCEVGAGCGKVSKYIYAQNSMLDLTCIEHNSKHFAQIVENFQTRTNVITPDIKVKAHLIKGCLPDLSFISSDSYDLVFTSAVMMHIPFIPAVESLMEIYRISKKYILHVENKNGDVVLSSFMSPLNVAGIDYCKIYEALGVKTLIYSEFKNPHGPEMYILYLGEK